MIKLSNVSKFYYNKGIITSGFTKVNLQLDKGEFVVITGESGSGKSTLLNVISGLDTYEEGEMYIDGKETSHYTEKDFEQYRNKYIGNIFQNFNLVNSYTVYQNIELVLLINGYSRQEAEPKVKEIISRVKLEEFEKTKVSKLSGGQKQRVAIARALAKETEIIVADEPTGNLDSKSAKSVIEILSEIAKDKLIIVVTHNYEQFEKYATRRIKMNDGRITEDETLSNSFKSSKFEFKKESKNNGEIKKANLLRLGTRNVFNIASKFILLMIVFLFLIFSVSGEYGALKKNEVEMKNNGHNVYFTNSMDTRIVTNKRDKKPFTKADYNKIKNIDGVKSVNNNDLIIDKTLWLEGNMIGSDTSISSIKDLHKKVEYGQKPTKKKEIVIEVNSHNYYFNSKARINEHIGKKVNLSDYTGEEEYVDPELSNLKISGIIVNDNLSTWVAKAYLNEDIINNIKMNTIKDFSDVKIKANNQIIDINKGEMKLQINSKVPKGKIYASENINSFYKDGNGINQNIEINLKNIYQKNKIDIEIDKIVTKNNIKKLTGIENYEDNTNNIFMNPEDMAKLVSNKEYQCSVLTKDISDIEDVTKQLKKIGMNPLPLKDAKQVYQLDELMFKIIKVPLVMFMIITMFFISYFVIRLILRSRSGYYIILRILGMNDKNAKRLLDIELLIDANIAFLILMIVFSIAKTGIIKVKFLITLVNLFTPLEIFGLYLVIMAMVYLISRRFTRNLFKKSAMGTFREEV